MSVNCLFSPETSQQPGASTEAAAVCYSLNPETGRPWQSMGIQQVSLSGFPPADLLLEVRIRRPTATLRFKAHEE